MWISIQDSPVNFDLVLTYYIKGNILNIVDINRETTPYYYETEEKAVEIKNYLNKKLKVITE